ncbi:pyrroline-5-carboxylate reductase [Paludibacterium yongneupense]|uniref:pyrroline-5-carboxylate reductase n=1 Tax=Paludibacterium yongneupense TaxID=400061 RepID=UPI0004205CF6|nr:pyrroline-5-carboxylate reductase [Paludibacterium yongneupense]
MLITFIGGGNMAGAIISGLVRVGGHRLTVVEPDTGKCAELARRFGLEAGPALPDRFGADKVVVLAVKPQQLKEICLALADRLDGALVISIAAGIRFEALARWLGTERIVRVMPNTPALLARGVSGVFAPAALAASDVEIAATVMRSVGTVHRLEDESGIDDITAISGSGPAYVFYFIESMIAAARDVGFDAGVARELVLSTFEGAVALARDSELEVAQLRQNVMSKGGTTERAILRFEEEGVKQAIVAGAMDCRARSVELGQQLSQD